MHDKSNIASSCYSYLEKEARTVTDQQKNNISNLFDLLQTEKVVADAQALAEIEEKAYSGLKKYFKWRKNV